MNGARTTLLLTTLARLNNGLLTSGGEIRVFTIIDRTVVERRNSFKFLGVHIAADLGPALECNHKEYSLTPLLPETIEEIWYEYSIVPLQVYCREHNDWLHHALVQEPECSGMVIIMKFWTLFSQSRVSSSHN